MTLKGTPITVSIEACCIAVDFSVCQSFQASWWSNAASQIRFLWFAWFKVEAQGAATHNYSKSEHNFKKPLVFERFFELSATAATKTNDPLRTKKKKKTLGPKKKTLHLTIYTEVIFHGVVHSIAVKPEKYARSDRWRRKITLRL